MGQRWLDGYSAEVEIYLLVNGKRFDVAQIGNGSLILRPRSDSSLNPRKARNQDRRSRGNRARAVDGEHDESEKLIPFF